jgi:hypothetical protein
MCEFDFDVGDYGVELDTPLLKEHGWYSPTNKGNNLGGVSRDHMYSVLDGFKNKIDPEIIKHPMNCELLLQTDNSKKKGKSSITLEELLVRIKTWET